MRDWFLLFDEEGTIRSSFSLLLSPIDGNILLHRKTEEERGEEASDRIILVSWTGKLTKDF